MTDSAAEGPAHASAATALRDAERLGVLEEAFRRAPTFLHVLRGPDFVVELANPACYQLVGHRDLIGRPAFEALPEAAAGGFPERLARVMATGEPFVGRELPVTLARTPGAPPEERLIDLVYLPLVGPDGRCERVLGHGTDVTEQVRARRQSEARFRTVQDASPHGLVLLRPERERASEPAPEAGAVGAGRISDFRIQYANPAGARLTGRRADAMVGRTLTELFPTTRDLGLLAAYVRVVDTGEMWEDDVRYVADGLEAGYHLAAVRVGDGADAELGLLYVDATARLAAEAERARLVAELAAEREGLRSVVLHMPAPVALLEGPEHRFALVNDAYRRVSGGGRDVTGLTPPEAFPELAGSGIYELFDQVYATGEPWDGPETLCRYDRDGTGVQDTWFNLRFEPVRDAGGRVVAILNFAVDVTDQVRARREVERLLAAAETARAEAERAALITHRVTTHLADGVCLMDAEGRLTYMNPAAERILGWTEAELLGDVLHDRVHYQRPDGSPFPQSECLLGQVLTEARPVLGLRDQWVRKGGAFVHVVTTCSPIVSEGRVVGAVLSLHDDTERRLVEADRERLLADAEAARGAAEAANRAKSDFLAVMSHELRTPLNAIGGYAELIELGIHGHVTEAQRTALERIQRSQRHLLGLIAGVLDYSRVEAGAVSYRLADVPVADAVAEAELLVAPQLRAKGLGYTWSGAAPGLCVRADREKLQQILLNLLGNAAKFTNARGGTPGRIEVTCTVEAGPGPGPAGDRVHLHVRDTGQGVAADQLARIFEPFVQADQRLTRPHEGVGLGLAISRDLARGMGGELTAESTPGVGSTFTLTLPVS